jgi:hypothetical protein
VGKQSETKDHLGIAGDADASPELRTLRPQRGGFYEYDYDSIGYHSSDILSSFGHTNP